MSAREGAPRHGRVGLALAIAAAATVVAPAASPAAPWERSGIEWSTAPTSGPEPTFRPPRAQRFTLGNGIAVLVVENHRLPLVALTLVMPDAGSAQDPADRAGLAAFCADLLDEGAGQLSALEIAATLDGLGATLAVGASVDAALVHVSSLAATLDPTLEVLAQVVTAPRFDAGEAARVHSDRLTGLRLRRDRPAEIAGIVLAGALFGPDSPYGHPTSGTIAGFERLTVADARAFYDGHWRPVGMTVVVAGDVSPATLLPRLEATLGAWRPVSRPAPARPVIRAARAPGRLLLVDRPGAEQSELRIGLPSLPRTDPRYVPAEVLQTILGGGFTSRLNQRLREDLGFTYGASSWIWYRRDAGQLTIATSVFTPKTADSLREIRKIVKDLAARQVPAEELQRARQNLIRALPQAFETNSGIADTFADLALHGLPDTYYDGYVDAVRKVTAADVRRMARELVPEDRLVFSVVGDLASVRPVLERLGLGRGRLHDPDGQAERP